MDKTVFWDVEWIKLLFMIRAVAGIRILRYSSETHSLVIVWNRKLSEWKDMGADRHLAETLRKRLLANAQLIHLK